MLRSPRSLCLCDNRMACAPRRKERCMRTHDKDIIDEIHERRAELLAQFDNDFERFAEYISERERQHPERVVDQVNALRTKTRERQNDLGI